MAEEDIQPEESQVEEPIIEQLQDQLLRAQAEFDNFRRRTREQQELMRTSAQKDVLLDMLQVHDLLTLALTQGENTELHTGVQMVRDQFTSTLEKYGVSQITEETFDPAKHEAVSTQPSDQPEGTIIAVTQPGYMLGDTVLRTAKVVVSSGGE